MYRILEAPPLAEYKGRDRYPIDLADDAALERLIRARADTIYHPVGTARMGSDAARCAIRSCGARRGGPLRRRCLDHAAADRRQHQRAPPS
jgi:choline dehydrogenase-like flavoprotein